MSDTRGEARGARFDQAIDRAVREMLDVEPPAGLRGRVLDRLDLSTHSVASSVPGLSERLRVEGRRRIAWIAGPVGAAAVIVVAMLAPWRHAAQPLSSTPIIAKAQPKVVVPNTEAPKPAQARTASMTQAHATPSGRQPSPRGVEGSIVVAADAAADDARTAIDPLAPIAPITVPAARPASITPTEIAISPLPPIAELQIAPLSPPERRN
ncbi:MAG TPA: hypothetical protein VF921_05725 [Vicinamibacterales bacterium]